MKFLQQYARFILPMPYLFLAAVKTWEVMHGGDKQQLIGSVGWLIVALLFYAGQKHIHDKRNEKTAG